MRRQFLVAGGVVLVLLLLFGFGRLRRHVTEDASWCQRCHQVTPEFAVWTPSAHQALPCQRCHPSTVDEGFSLIGRMLTAGGGTGPAHAQPDDDACVDCHATSDSDWSQVGAARGHRDHLAIVGVSCSTCHGGAIHRFVPASDTCQSCHADSVVRIAGMQALHCFACHDFLSTTQAPSPTREDCLRCHLAAGVDRRGFAEGAHVGYECTRCHRPHDPDDTVVPCESCHTGALPGEAHAVEAHRPCTACHSPHQWTAQAAVCGECHDAGGD